MSRYWGRYRLVLVTNLRSFQLVGQDDTNGSIALEAFRLAEDADDFWHRVEKPRAFARDVGVRLGEYLLRALSLRAALVEPKDLAWLLASYARDGLTRVEAAGNVPSLGAVRSTMEEALGIRFEGERGERFFRSTLIQTLFYGVFSAWVLWSRAEQEKNGPLFENQYGSRRFRWRDEKRADYRPHVFEGNKWLSSAQHLRKGAGEPQTWFTRDMGSLHLIERGALMFPAWLSEEGLSTVTGTERRANLSGKAQRYLARIGLGVEDLFHHVLATLHDPAYREANAGALRMEWPRVPLPGWPDGEADGASQALTRSAARGRKLAALLDSEQPISDDAGTLLSPEIAVPDTATERYMAGEDFAVTAGWGHFGTGDAVMPGRGRIVERGYRRDERSALAEHVAVLGETTFDVYLNGEAFWRNVPSAIWDYRLGGYQVLKKWLSYRESAVLGRRLLPEEVQHFADTARRIGALLIATSGAERISR